jgi:hypothetical protein
MKAYVVYTIKLSWVDQNYYRRYSDFYALRETLVERWPGVYIPNIPGKKAVVNIQLIKN